MELNPSYRIDPDRGSIPDVFASNASYRETAEAVARLAVPAVAWACIIDLIEDGVLTRRGVAAAAAVTLPHFPAAPHVDAPEGAAVAARTGSPRYYGRGWLAALARDDTTIAALGRTTLRSFTMLPLRVGFSTIGVITFACEHEIEAPDPALEAFARDAALAIEMSRLREDAAEARRRASETQLRLGILARTGGAFLESFDVPSAIRRFLEHTIPAFADGACAIVESGGVETVYAGGAFDRPSVRSLGAAAVEAGRSVFGEAGCVLATPLLGVAKVRGSIVFSRRPVRPPFVVDDLTLVETFGARAASFVGVATTYARERHVSHTLQFALRPQKLQPIAGLPFVAAYRPSDLDTDLDVGGDWYDVIELDSDRVAFVIGDVMGHGVEAAAAMAQLRSGITANLHAGLGPAQCLSCADRVLADLEGVANFATAAVAILSRSAKTLTLSNAGHPPPLIRRGDALDEPAPSALMLGIDRVSRRADTTVPLNPGDLVAFYTDGVFEDREKPYLEGFGALRAALLGASDMEDARERLFDLIAVSTDDRTLLLATLER